MDKSISIIGIELVDCLLRICYDLNYEMEERYSPGLVSYNLYGYLESSTFRMAKRAYLSDIFSDEYTRYGMSTTHKTQI